jgi:molybdenum transport protein
MDLALDDAALLALLRDDVPHGDLTTASLGIGTRPGRIEFFARGDMTLCASEEAARMFELAGATVDLLLPSGSTLAAGAPFLRAQGSVASLHRVWKVAQTLCEYASGIATAAAAIVGALREAGLAVPVACTRKNFPGTKALAIKAAHAGGAVMHRLGLSESLLLFAEHRAFIEPDELLPSLLRLKRSNPERKLVAEVGSVDEALRLAAYGVEVLQLEKFSPDEVGLCRDALAAAGWSPLLAAAGGVTAANAVAYARAGADLLVTSAPYFAKPADVKVSLLPLAGCV